MSTQSTPPNIPTFNYGKEPGDYGNGNASSGGDTNRSSRGEPGSSADLPVNPLLKYLTGRVAPVDPTSKPPQYAVKRQKIVTLTKTQLAQLQKKDLLIWTGSGSTVMDELKSINDDPDPKKSKRIIWSDCPDVVTAGEVTYTVLLDWDEETVPTFPDLFLQDKVTGVKIPLPSQANNFLVVSNMDEVGGSNPPPPYPPVAATGPINTQPSDFKVASEADIKHYGLLNGRDKSPAVAVMDTGLKFNLHAKPWPQGAYVYRDADGHKRRFTLAYQDPSDTGCEGTVMKGPLGYCALQSYRQDVFVNKLQVLSPESEPLDFTPSNVVNSPYDDMRVFSATDQTSIRSARHGTSITAIIQQNGDNAPVLPVKAFDNMGFATLFDVLNGLNYILHRCKSANIRVVNASWVFGRDEPLLRKKIEQLMEAHVFVVAAAGNEYQTPNRSLDAIKVYPACYSTELPNVITVTSVRRTFLPPRLMSYRGDSIIGKLESRAIEDFGLFRLLKDAYKFVAALLPATTHWYVAVENYSPNYVNVGVVSTFGYFRSPFWTGKPMRGSSYACAFVSGFVIRQLRTRPDSLPSEPPVSAAQEMTRIREELLKAMSGQDKDNLGVDYVAGGYYLAGYDVV